MKIGIDISQIAYENTGVSNYLRNLIQNLSLIDKENEYVLFYSSLRNSVPKLELGSNFKIKSFKMPQSFLNILWNNLHIYPVEKFVGKVDVFITSDWVEPPSRSKKATILYDLIVYKYPKETDARIIEVQKSKLKWVIKESSKILCISEATKKDAQEILGIESSRLEVINAGV